MKFKILITIILVGAFFISCKSSKKQALRIYDKNPFYWQYKGEPVLLLGGSWQDNLFNHPAGLEEHLDLLVAVGGNYLRNVMSHREEGNVFAYAQNDEGQFDLDRFNEEYWRRFEDFIKMTFERDIIVQIEIFDAHDHFEDHQSRGGWSKHPFNPANNVTFTSEESGLPEVFDVKVRNDPGKHPFWLAVPAQRNNELVLRYQQAYVDKMLSISLEYPNVIYCIQNESGEVLDFGDYWADYIHRRAADKGRTAYVTDMRYSGDVRHSDHLHIFDNPERFNFLDISQNSTRHGQEHYDRFLHVRDHIAENPRPINTAKIYNRFNPRDSGRDDEESVARMFRIIFAGGASARFHRPHPLEADAHETATLWGLGLSPRAQGTIRSARTFTDVMNVFSAEPRNDLLSDRQANEAYCLADPGSQYAVYFPDGGEVKLDLSTASGKFQVHWLEVDSSTWHESPETTTGGEALELKAPRNGNWAVLISAADP